MLGLGFRRLSLGFRGVGLALRGLGVLGFGWTDFGEQRKGGGGGQKGMNCLGRHNPHVINNQSSGASQPAAPMPPVASKACSTPRSDSTVSSLFASQRPRRLAQELGETLFARLWNPKP